MVKSLPPVFLFIGSENHLKEKAINELKVSTLGDSTDSLDYKVFRGGESDIKEVLDCAATFPFSSGKRFIVLKDAEKITSGEMPHLAADIKKPSKFTCLVIDSKGDSILEDLAPLSGSVNISRFDELPDDEIGKWVGRYLASRGKRMESGAAEIFIEFQRKNLLYLMQELEKLIAFTGERAEITPRDVEELVGRSAVRDAFEMVRLIGSKDIAGAVRIASDLMAAGKKPYEIIGLLCWHLKSMMRAGIMLEKGETEYRTASALGINRRYAPDFFREVSRAGSARIKAHLKALLEADLDIKRTRFDPALAVEFVIMRLCLG